MTKIPFSTNGNRAREGFEYFITFINDYSIYGYVYILHRKYEAFEKFKEFWAEVETQLNKNINFWSDRGGEYLSGDFNKYLLDNRILSQLSSPGML